MWQHDDNSGDWQGLDSPRQAPRYATIAEMLRTSNADRKVLDVGCGEAVLRAWLPKGVDYIGIDQSALAIRRGIERNTSVKIIHASAETFDANGERFDSIVFDEMLYYAADPVGLLRKYVTMLLPDGVILCSIYQKPGRASLKRRLWHLFDHRRPVSNIHCAEMVRAFMARKGWPISDDRAVAIPGAESHWHIWVARPHGAV